MNKIVGYQTQARRGLRRCVAVSLFALSALLGALTSIHAQTLTWLGTLGGNRSIAYDVSDNGDVVVGEAFTMYEGPRAFRWTPNTGMQQLPSPTGNPQYGPHRALDVSADGTVIVGQAFFRACRWENDSVTVMTPIMPFHLNAWATGISNNKEIIVGAGRDDNTAEIMGHRWYFATPTTLGNVSGYSQIMPAGISGDGNYIFGEVSNTIFDPIAFRWSQLAGYEFLGPMAGGYIYNSAYAASTNGAVIVGMAMNSSGDKRAFRWVVGQGMQDLGGREAFAVSGDGTIVVGYGYNGWSFFAARWVGNTMEDLNTTYASIIPPSSRLERAYGISADGRYIVGEGYNDATGRNEAFLLDTQGTPPPQGDVDGNGCVDDADLLIVLFNFGCTGSECSGDANNDSIVDDADLLIVLFNFGSGC